MTGLIIAALLGAYVAWCLLRGGRVRYEYVDRSVPNTAITITRAPWCWPVRRRETWVEISKRWYREPDMQGAEGALDKKLDLFNAHERIQGNRLSALCAKHPELERELNG